jgi:hypothetical protein
MIPKRLSKNNLLAGTSTASISTFASTSSKSSTTKDILLDLDKVKQIQYWKKKAMKAIHDNCHLTDNNKHLQEKICSLGEDNLRMKQDLAKVSRPAKDSEMENALLKGSVQYLKCKSRHSLVANNYTITEDEIVAVAKGKDSLELIVDARQRRVKEILGTSFRSKWANRNFLDETRDDGEI